MNAEKTSLLTSSQVFAALSITAHRNEALTDRLERVTEKAEKRDWVWGAVTLAACFIMSLLAWKVFVLQATIEGVCR